MRRLLSASVLLAIGSFSCHPPMENSVLLTCSLVSEVPVAEQISFIKGGRPVVSGTHRVGIKLIPSLVQNRPGSISFYQNVQRNALLRYGLIVSREIVEHLNPRIVVESDYPSAMRREYSAKAGGTEKIPLTDFSNRAVRITFAAGDATSQRFRESIFWVDPAIEYRVASPRSESKELSAFRQRSDKNNVLVILLDAAAASHLSCYGYPRRTTPAIDSLAARGILFENAIAQAPYTTASTGTLLTGLYPDVHGVGVEIDHLPDTYQTLAEVFLHAGYETALFTGNPNASPLWGFGQGFRKVWNARKQTFSFAGDFIPEVTSWLKEVGHRPFFAYLHFREPHAPYKPPQEFLRLFGEDHSVSRAKKGKAVGRMINGYDANLAYVDAQVGKILHFLRSAALDTRTIIIVLSDHGEAFREHGFRGHNRHVYEELIRIPLVVFFPGEPSLSGIRKPDLVGTLDVAPTLMDALGLSAKGVPRNGRSFLPLIIENFSQPERILLSRSRPPGSFFGLRSRKFKYISQMSRSSYSELYSLAEDPLEQKNLTDVYPILSSYYRSELQKQLEELQSLGKRMPRPPKSGVQMDEQTREELRALGYIDQ